MTNKKQNRNDTSNNNKNNSLTKLQQIILGLKKAGAFIYEWDLCGLLLPFILIVLMIILARDMPIAPR